MTLLLDIPDSGIYFQQGAIVQLVVQLLDINTGLPIQLQAATALTISLLYPDLVTTQSFPATLYTDGSDGKIYYTTENDGTTIDLLEFGLYQMQGTAVVGGVQLPPSYRTDFYVLKNVFGGSTMPVFTPSAVVMYDSSNVRWVGTVTSSGVLHWTALASGPNSFLQFNQLVMKDPNGVYWTLSISTVGVISGVPGGTFPEALESFFLADTANKTWIITVSDVGALVAS